MRRCFSLILLSLTPQFAAAQQLLTLTPQQGVVASVYLSDSTLKINFSGIVKKSQSFEIDLPPTTNLTMRQVAGMHSPYIEAWHLDEGMGTYTIHRLFSYQTFEQRFAERKPICGEQFINLRPQEGQTALVYSTFDVTSNTWRMCKDP